MNSLSSVSQHSTTNSPVYNDLVFYYCFSFFPLGFAENLPLKSHPEPSWTITCRCIPTARSSSARDSSSQDIGCTFTGYLLSAGIHSSSKSFPMIIPTSTSSTLVAHPQVAIVGVTQVPVPEKSPSTETAINESIPSTSSGPEVTPSKCHKIMPTPIPTKSSSIPNLHSIIVPELVVLKYALPEWIHHQGGCKDYKCWLCVFHHMNRDCMLMHIQQYLEISVGCPMCSKGFQNGVSLHKHGWQVHSVSKVESEHE